MSLIIAYIGKKGSVMASDKRRIAFSGNIEAREQLEKELYSGEIHNEEELYKRSSQLGVNIKINDDTFKVKNVEDSVMGEVITKGPHETKRKRIYGVCNAYQMIEILGSDLSKSKGGKTGIIIFGNAYCKKTATELVNKQWKASYSLKYMGDIFEKIIKEVATKTPTVSDEVDIVYSQKTFTEETGKKYLEYLIKREINLLSKFRDQLKEDLLKQTRGIELAQKIINEGDIGFVNNIKNNRIEVKLKNDVCAYDFNWKELAGPGEKVIMFFNENEDVKIGDKIVISSEELCTERNKTSLTCDVILCNTIKNNGIKCNYHF